MTPSIGGPRDRSPVLRARTAQWGRHGGGKYAYGHTLIADPWGHVIAKAQDKVGYIAARLDLDEVERVRRRMPCADHRVL